MVVVIVSVGHRPVLNPNGELCCLVPLAEGRQSNRPPQLVHQLSFKEVPPEAVCNLPQGSTQLFEGIRNLGITMVIVVFPKCLEGILSKASPFGILAMAIAGVPLANGTRLFASCNVRNTRQNDDFRIPCGFFSLNE